MVPAGALTPPVLAVLDLLLLPHAARPVAASVAARPAMTMRVVTEVSFGSLGSDVSETPILGSGVCYRSVAPL